MKVVLAPLAGFTDAPFRALCRRGGADLVYTEMVSAAGLAHGSSPTKHLLETFRDEGPVACQLFGSNESDLANAARQIDATRFCEINLNAGCPMTKVTRCGAGAELVRNPAKIGRLIKAIAENTSLPVTLKTRLGPHPGSTTAFAILDAAEQAGAKGVCFHARYTSQMHGGEVYLDTLAELVKQAKIPITGNGSVKDAKGFAAMRATGVAAIMVGRAAISNPGVFAMLKGETPPTEDWFSRHLEGVLAFRDQLAERFPNDHIPEPDAYASVKMHVHLFRYFAGRPGAAALRARLNSVRTLAEIRQLAASLTDST